MRMICRATATTMPTSVPKTLALLYTRHEQEAPPGAMDIDGTPSPASVLNHEKARHYFLLSPLGPMCLPRLLRPMILGLQKKARDS
jgi:hypothetical protein